jgi:poly(3-hydroxyalkanoate) depolymerase
VESPNESSTEDAAFVEVDGHRIRYRVRGSGSPLLLIMGLGGHLDLWEPFQSAMSQFQTITFDAPGTGRSSTPTVPLRLSRLARLTSRLVDTLGYRRVDVLGVSLGGALAQELTRQAPRRVRRLVLVSTACGIGAIPGNPLALLSLATPQRYYSRSFFESRAPSIYGGRLRTDQDLVQHVAGQWLAQPPNLWGYVSQTVGLWGWTSLPWLHQITQPTLVLSGDDDPIVPAINSRILAARIPGARLEILPGGHLVMVEQTETVSHIVRNFLQQEMRR